MQPGQAAALLRSGGGLKDVNSMVPTVVQLGLGLGISKGSVQKPDRTTACPLLQQPPTSTSPSSTGPGSTNSRALASSPTTPVTNGQINNNNKYELTNSSPSQEIIPTIIRNTTLTNNTTRESNYHNNKIITTTAGGPEEKIISSQKSPKVLTLSGGSNPNHHTTTQLVTTGRFKNPFFFSVKPPHVYCVYYTTLFMCVLVGFKSTYTYQVLPCISI